jgi:hypothetical protein
LMLRVPQHTRLMLRVPQHTRVMFRVPQHTRAREIKIVNVINCLSEQTICLYFCLLKQTKYGKVI